MAKRKTSNLLALAVLSLLTERPMHPYEILTVMQVRQLSAVIKLNQSSLYAVIEALQREGWIVPVETRREGRYPERTVYATTEAGRTELADWLRSLLQKPAPEYTQFAAGLAFLGHLAPTEVVVLLKGHQGYLQEEISRLQALIQKANTLGIDRLFLTEDRYTLALLESRSSFIQQLIEEIHDGTLTEIKDGEQVWKIQHPEMALLEQETDS